MGRGKEEVDTCSPSRKFGPRVVKCEGRMTGWTLADELDCGPAVVKSCRSKEEEEDVHVPLVDI